MQQSYNEPKSGCENKKLLLISCSAKKKKFQHLAPAIEVYDGPLFRMLRKIKRSRKCPHLHVKIISAKYGLITPSTLINYYDKRITKEELLERNSALLSSLITLFRVYNYSEIFICLGKDYLSAISGFENYVPPKCRLTYSQGKIGQKLKQTRDWILHTVENFNSQT